MTCLRYCFVLILLVYLLSFNLTSAKFLDPEWDLPTKVELNKYLSVAEASVHYCYRNIDNLTLDSAFGLFIAEVNLSHARRRGRAIPKSVNVRIANIIEKISYIFNVIKRYYEVQNDHLALNMMSLFNNATYWAEKLPTYEYHVEKQYTLAQLQQIYSPFNLYLEKAFDYYELDPTPVTSDLCMDSLSKTTTNRDRYATPCHILKFCYDTVKRGTNLGYALAHRLLILLAARSGRGCTVFSEHEDRALLKELCSKAHAEAVYIAKNNFGLVDLFMEFIAVCSIDGHAQFLRRNWLDNIIKFQTPEGCYQAVHYKKKIQEKKFRNILLNGCFEHPTTLASVVFSAAVRFIIEEYY